MSRFRIGLLTAAALAVTAPAIAQAPDGRDGGPRRAERGGVNGGGYARTEGAGRIGQQRYEGQFGGRRDAMQAPQARPDAPQARTDERSLQGPRGDDRQRTYAGNVQGYPNADRRYDPNRDPGRVNGDNRDFGRPGYAANRNGPRGYANADRRNDPRWNNGPQGRVGPDWRNDRRFDWRGYRDGHRDQYRLGRYVPPRGWSYGYRRFSAGFRIDPFFYASNYWISDPYAYRLPPVWGTYRWVRYYDDALLIDTATGMVVDAIPDFFW
jgi:hypothetical protein